MSENNKTLNDYCNEFQQLIIDNFNEEQHLPFILKYYLIKEIWENIQSTKTKMDMESRAKMTKTVYEPANIDSEDESIEDSEKEEM